MQSVITLDEVSREAKKLLESIVVSEMATIVGLSGNLGAGKTVFAQSIARELGVEDHVTSPTFVIEKIYQLPTESGRGFERLIHIDAYRLAGAHELEVLGWKDVIADPRNLIVIEWPEHVREAMPTHMIQITLGHTSEYTRTITYGKEN